MNRRTAAQLLRTVWRESGYARLPNRRRLRAEGPDTYKKGYEVRLVVDTVEEVEQVRRALEAVGLKAGAPFRKHARIVVPVYGREMVAWFTELDP